MITIVISHLSFDLFQENEKTNQLSIFVFIRFYSFESNIFIVLLMQMQTQLSFLNTKRQLKNRRINQAYLNVVKQAQTDADKNNDIFCDPTNKNKHYSENAPNNLNNIIRVKAIKYRSTVVPRTPVSRYTKHEILCFV